MTFRTRLLLIFALVVVAAVAVVELLVTARTRQAFERLETQRVLALVAQFRSEFARRGQEIARAVEGIAHSDEAVNIAIATDFGPYVKEAAALAAAHGLDLLELVTGDGSIISSAQWSARFGYKEEWLASGAWKTRGAFSGAFLKREELPAGSPSRCWR